jgi:hypothetical protein
MDRRVAQPDISRENRMDARLKPAAAALALLFMASAHAAIAPPSLADTSFFAIRPAQSATLSYVYASETLLAVTPFGSGCECGGAKLWIDGISDSFDFAHPDATDLFGTFTFQASIDHSGTMHGGSFSWSGFSDTLGVQGTFLSGSILDGSTDSGSLSALGDLSYINPDFQAWLRPTSQVFIEYQAAWGSNVALFDHDFVSLTGTEAPGITGIASSVPEPSMLALLTLALVSLAFEHSRASWARRSFFPSRRARDPLAH